MKCQGYHLRHQGEIEPLKVILDYRRDFKQIKKKEKRKQRENSSALRKKQTKNTPISQTLQL